MDDDGLLRGFSALVLGRKISEIQLRALLDSTKEFVRIRNTEGSQSYNG